MQTELTDILEHSFRTREKSLDKYIQENALEYIGCAKLITPSLTDWGMIWDRVAFAILSANTGFRQAVKALAYATEHKGNVSKYVLMGLGMVPAKAEYLNQLAVSITTGGKTQFDILKDHSETWIEYRLRLKNEVKGLGLAKASFAASLLYPLDSDLACLDTWMQKHFLSRYKHTAHSRLGFRTLGLKDYLIIEEKVRQKARKHGINTFLCQWLIWDYLRGSKTDHAIFPGSHK